MIPITPVIIKVKEFLLNDYRVIVVDAPENATHSSLSIQDGLNFLVHRKSKIIAMSCVDQSISDGELENKYFGKLIHVGSLKTTDEAKVAILFNVVKHGNFYDYEHNGIFYPNAVSALKDIIEQEINFLNPYVLTIKPF